MSLLPLWARWNRRERTAAAREIRKTGCLRGLCWQFGGGLIHGEGLPGRPSSDYWGGLIDRNLSVRHYREFRSVRSCKEIWDFKSCPLPLLHGIAPGSGTHASLQEMPQTIWDVFETFLDEDFYLKWWATLDGKIHPAWSGQPRIPESILLIAEDLHWGVGLNYVQCGPQGEPSVVHVEMEGPEPEEFLREIAPDFMTFLRMLEFEED